MNRRILKDCSTNQFVTVFYGILDPITGMLAYCNAGHCPPLQFRTGDDERVHELVRTGLPLWISEDMAWEQESVRLMPGDVLVLYTDGITEAHRELPLLFGKKNLVDSVRATLGTAGSQRPMARAIQDGILADVHRFVSDAPPFDDIALTILVRR